MRIIENDQIPEENTDDNISVENTEEIIASDIPQEISVTEKSVDGSKAFIVEEEIEIDEIYSDSSLDPLRKKDGLDESGNIGFTAEENADEINDEYSELTDLFKTDDEDFVITQDETLVEEKMNFFVSLWKNKRRRAKIAYALVTIMLIFVGTGYGVLNALLGQLESGEEEQASGNDIGEEVIYDDDDFDLFTAVSTASSLNDYIDQWYESGTAMYSKNVINVLLVGLDSSDGLTTGDSRSDTMMLVSLNTKTKKISMVSLFRDTWAKYVPSDGKVYFGKMNGSYRYGGINCTVQTIEKMFKIRIDHYAIVDFRNFKKLVNAVGGVDVYVQEYEAKNMKREWNIDVDFSQSEDDLVHLDGEQAFWFARQRHCDADADVSRTRRQRQVITAFIDSCKGASLSQLKDALDEVFKFVKTDLKKNEIIGYATKALAWGWINYPIESVNISDPEVFKTPTLKGQSIVVQDYPKVAQIIQNALYGSSNIVLEDGRRIIFSLY